jgi:hypothetical protein
VPPPLALRHLAAASRKGCSLPTWRPDFGNFVQGFVIGMVCKGLVDDEKSRVFFFFS